MERPTERIRVLIVDDIAETRENLRKLLSFDIGIEVVGAASSGQEGIDLAKEFQPHIVLMDINMPGMDGISATEVLLQKVPTAQVVILSVQGETDYVRRAMLAGARDFLTKPPSGDELMGTIRRVYEKGRARAEMMPPVGATASRGVSARMQGGARRAGQVIAVFGPKGGVGCTTIAVNLAIALQQVIGGDRKVALVDTNLQFGDVGVMLNLQASRSIADLASQAEEVDSDMLNSVLTPHSSGIKTLLAPPHPEAAEGLLNNPSPGGEAGGGSRLGTILKLMRKEFDIVVVDTWSWVDETTLTVFDAASMIILVVMPNIPSIKNARLFLEVAYKLNYSDIITLVVNGVNRRVGIRTEQIEQAMIPVTAQIPSDEQAVLASVNRGVPFIIRDRSRPISQGILHLAGHIRDMMIDAEEEEAREEAPLVATGAGGTGLLRLRHVFERR
ncbi:MAG: response regulator [Chloroflexi bacterium]|nr:response regulator [Chloroflexota bacterium]